jgi:hypothetical protein
MLSEEQQVLTRTGTVHTSHTAHPFTKQSINSDQRKMLLSTIIYTTQIRQKPISSL